jgi:PPM family protein phosphatase
MSAQEDEAFDEADSVPELEIPPWSAQPEFGRLQDVGSRPSQQDALACGLWEGGEFVVVIDGMGGHAGGDVAAILAVEFIARECRRHFPPEDPGNDAISTLMSRIVSDADGLVWNYRRNFGAFSDMAATVVFAVRVGEVLHVLSIGDSRLYIHDAAKLTQLTTDHVAVVHNREMVTSALGGIHGVCRRTVNLRAMLGGSGLVLLCSDGLYRPLKNDEIELELTKGIEQRETAQGMCHRLMAALKAKSRSKPTKNQDNVTILIISYTETAPAQLASGS